jgi:DNA-binding CsgD family transcriptional regulator
MTIAFWVKRIFPVLTAFFLIGLQPCAAKADPLLEKGWAALTRDNDTQALRYFGEAYVQAFKENDTLGKAETQLYMGICSYGVSYSKGLNYCYRAMDEYKKLEQTRPGKAIEGRSRCLLLMATIESRRGNTDKAYQLNHEALKGFAGHNDSTHSVGLIYSGLGNYHFTHKQKDSAAYYFHLSLQEHLRANSIAYLPTAYQQLAALETDRSNKTLSLHYYQQALQIADSSANRQAQVTSWLGLGKWHTAFEGNNAAAEMALIKAKDIANGLSDKTFSLKAHQALLEYYKATGNFKEALSYQQSTNVIADSIYSWDRLKEIKDLEIQYNVAGTEKKLKLVSVEREVTLLTNYLLWGGIVALVLLFGGIVLLFRRNSKRDRLLLQTKDALVQATEQQKQMIEEQKKLKEKQMQQDIEFKESQLTAMTVQMMQKNELLQELKARMDEDKIAQQDQGIHKIINKGLNQDKEWSDFNLYFESMNQHFYSRIKEAYPDISPNDLKICALIKLHLSIKEMATILNISPDSVKTARYRLRKKLQLNNEDNLTEFIMQL